ncbi:hypothetical protein DEA8626_02454 [Defluviimonas aquaemixtae]|uniref:Thiol:disulfide interchange protein DsbD N-terminal domain-containing protein n=1 Tax=Albidovulum aquaemixtae TaxID=1542388 RepID=A0A2R8BJB8_9RHOB|nr:protein-disulfide reductase DsbD domain-containing protein [Defluviimonas aquaemixtae]SPH23390.1 hypothetical protein DEA8626_02454 [Defluviimonas aquaemixtae]
MIKNPPLLASLALGFNLAAVAAAAAQDMPANMIEAELRGGWRTESGSQMTALHLRLAPGWKTYWRAPGEAGFPPNFDWGGSDNVGGVAYHWPIPEVFELNGMRTIGYSDELVLPIEVRPADPDAPIHLEAQIDLGVCEEICVPVSVDVATEPDRNATIDPMIRAALALQPERSDEAGITSVRCAAEPIGDGLRLTAGLTMPPIGPEEFAVIELADRNVWISSADTHRDGDELSAVADLVPPNAQPFALDRSSVRITVFGGTGRVVEHQGCEG